MNNKIISMLAKLAIKAAEVAHGSASVCGYHQPKEPKVLKNIKK
ncbi:MAG: cyclic lactone autoinducer peptide [Ruminiclostridium sp.]